MFEEAMKNEGKKYSKDFLKAAKKQIAPAYLATTPKSDSRFGKEPILAYITDRTHASNALAELYTEIYGPEALSKPIYDKKGRPLNYILVKISGNKTKLTEKEFSDFMIQENHAFLEKWSRGPKGETVINKITFKELPEKVLDTTDNPWRAFIGEMQDEGMLDKIPVDYSQFKIAKNIQGNDAVTWDDISEGENDFKEAQEKTLEYLKIIHPA